MVERIDNVLIGTPGARSIVLGVCLLAYIGVLLIAIGLASWL